MSSDNLLFILMFVHTVVSDGLNVAAVLDLRAICAYWYL